MVAAPRGHHRIRSAALRLPNMVHARVVRPPAQAPRKPSPQPEGSGDRNAIPYYRLPNARVTHHFQPKAVLRTSAMRGLGAYCNVFAIESFMDELARAAKVDPVAFRLRHLEDPRAIDVVKLAAEKFGWDGYKNLASYCALVPASPSWAPAKPRRARPRRRSPTRCSMPALCACATCRLTARE
jgi:CO/xanthine dehydrogenase Mo-binding subunit